ncbi:hypothetical protein C7999DRAFT_42011 [Corynascus novoguineensis]|uniref:Uncharacterized protein n=1 Tax=Corynascus novoguineensis TaxID=1126955 RepID=A0AAN7HMG1_9PEZI|nr:hypothetical protein C7999DRAFT_42011 [Corynascus novoguineensis]
MAGDLDLPIALRRTRRSISCTKQDSSCASPKRPTEETLALHTPKSKKRRVRISDPGPSFARTEAGEPSTGLTPIINRTSLSSSRISRRRSTPGRLFPSSSSDNAGIDTKDLPLGGEVHFLPLRQVLDGRVKRRIRRNGLSEEMNNISAERRRRAAETKAEIERLKAELAEKDEEIERLQDETVVLDTERVWELEQQVASLKRELASRSGVQQELSSSPPPEWTRAARDSYQDDIMDFVVGDDTEEFGEVTRADLACGTPTRRMLTSFPTPPATSPEPQLPQTPCRRSFNAPLSSVGVQATFPDPEKRQLEEELDSLRFEVNKLTATLESYSALSSRLSAKLVPLSNLTPCEPSSQESPDLEAHLTTVLQTLSDRTAALAELNSSLQELGFPGSDAFEVIESLRASFRSARLELEYITPGEITLPLNGAAAGVLDLVLVRLRDLAKRNRDAEDAIDEYRATQLSLRQQLGARVDAMDRLAAQLTVSERAVRDKDARTAELETGLVRARAAVRAYAHDVAALEAQLVERLGAEQHRDEEEAESDLEEKLAAAVAQTTALETQLAALDGAHKEQLATLNQAHGAALAERDARVSELRAQVEQTRDALHAAHQTVQRLRVENEQLGEANKRLREENQREKSRAEEVIVGMKGELERVMKAAEAFLNGAAAAGRQKRRYDSGLGLLDEEVQDVDA